MNTVFLSIPWLDKYFSDIAFIENNYSICKKFDSKFDKLENQILEISLHSNKQISDLSFIGNNYSIFKKMDTSNGNQATVSLNLQKETNNISEKDITFVGNNYSVYKKLNKTENSTFETSNNIFAKNSKINSSFDSAISFASNNVCIENYSQTIEKQPGIQQFSAWFSDTANENAMQISKEDISSKCGTEEVHEEMTNKYASNYKPVMSDEKTHLTAEEIGENKNKSEFMDTVLPLEPTADSQINTKKEITFEDNTDCKIDIFETENLLFKPTIMHTADYTDTEKCKEKENDYVEILEKIDFKIISNSQNLKTEAEDVNLLGEATEETVNTNNFSDFNKNVSTQSITTLNQLELFGKSFDAETIEGTDDKTINKESGQNIEQIQHALLKMQIQSTKNAAQIEEKILLQKLKITELELKIKEVEWNNLQKKEKKFENESI